MAGDYRFLGEADAMAKKWEEARVAREAKLDGLQELKHPGSDGDSRYLIPTSRLRSLGTA